MTLNMNIKETLSSLDELTPNPETVEVFQADLSTQSSVAIWRLSAWIYAFMAFILEGLWETKKTELQAIQDETPPHTRLWWTNKIKAYQEGDATTIDTNGNVTYETIDTDKNIVALATIQNVEGVWNVVEANATANSVEIYPAKENGVDVYGNTVWGALSSAEADGLRDYVNDIKPLGIKTEVKEANVGTISFLLNIYYDPKKVNYGGTLVSDPDRNVFAEQLLLFLSEDVNPKGVINKNRFKSYLTQGEGIEDVDVLSFGWSATSNGIYVNIGRQLEINGVAIQYDFNGVEPNWYTEDRI